MEKRPFKKRVKQFMHQALPTCHPPIIVASMGRSGSTLVWEAVSQGLARARFGVLHQTALHLVRDSAWDMEHIILRGGVVYKTHGLAHELPESAGARVVFLFGQASEAALSVLACHERYGADWIALHFSHLRANGPFEELGRRDVLRFEEQIDGWLGKTGVPRLALHYDALWNHVDSLSDFVGFPVTLPKRRARLGPASAGPEVAARFAETYAALDARIATMPSCQILS